MRFLAGRGNTDDPFLLKVSFHDPHARPVPSYKAMIQNRGDGPSLMMPFAPTEDQFRHVAAAEYGMITMIDDAVGWVITALERTGQADDTVVFTADHGDMFGDHGMMLKVSIHYEGCIRVPFLAAGPGIAPCRTDAFASSVDVCPTLIGSMGLRPYFGIHGHDLAPMLVNPGTSVRESVLVEELQPYPDPSTGLPIDMRTLVTDEGRLTVRCAEGGALLGDLHDHRADPGEMDNPTRMTAHQAFARG